MKTNTESMSAEETISISKDFALVIIEHIESIMYHSWYYANTMKTEEEYYDAYYRSDKKIIEQLTKEISK